MLVLLGVENRQRVAVGNAHHQAGEMIGGWIVADGCWIGSVGACAGGRIRGSSRGLFATAATGYRKCGNEAE